MHIQLFRIYPMTLSYIELATWLNDWTLPIVQETSGLIPRSVL